MKRLLILLMSLYILSTGLPLCASAADEGVFSDVSENDWYAWSVADTARRGLMIGTGNGQFSPEAELSRAMLITVLWRLAGQPIAPEGEAFSDVPAGKWYSDAVAWAKSASVAKGYGDGNFSPGDPVTREQVATFFFRWAQGCGYDVSFDGPGFDEGEDGEGWSLNAMAWAKYHCFLDWRLSYFEGQTGRTFEEYSLCPGDTATRGETAVFISRFCRAYGEEAGPEPKVLYRPVSDHSASSGYLWDFMTMELPEFWMGNVKVTSGDYMGVPESVYFMFNDLSNTHPRSGMGRLFYLVLWPEGKDSSWFGDWEDLGNAESGKSGYICTVDTGSPMGRLCLYVDYPKGAFAGDGYEEENVYNHKQPGNYLKLRDCIDEVLSSIRFDGGVTVVDVAPGFDIPLG